MIKLTRNREATLRSVVDDRDTWTERYEPGALRWLAARGLIVVEGRLAAGTDAGRDMVAELVKRDEDRAPKPAPTLKPINPNWQAQAREHRIRAALGRYVDRASRLDTTSKLVEAGFRLEVGS